MAEPTISKRCSWCEEDKTSSEFYHYSAGNLHKFCKLCVRKQGRDLYALKHPTRKKHGPRSKPFHFLVPYKRCSKCQTFKGGDKFCGNKRRPDGLSDWCRDCHKERNDNLAVRRAELAAHPKPPLTKKACTRCGDTKPTTSFYRNKHHSSGYDSSCKVCTEQSVKRKNEKGKQRVRKRYTCRQCGKGMWRRADYKAWQGLCWACLKPPQEFSTTRERRKLHGRSAYRTWRKAILDRDGHMCQACGSMERLEVDHIMPWSTHPELRYELSNGRTLCKPCHLTTDTYGSGAKKYNGLNAVPLMSPIMRVD